MRILSILLLFSISGLQAQTFSKQHTLEDLGFLKDNIKHYNPALYTYNPDFDVRSEALLNNIPENISLMDYFGLVSRMCALSNEGHFDLGSWSDTVHKGIPDGSYRYFPFVVKLVNNRLYVWKDVSNEKQLNCGDEILSINGRPVSQIIDLLGEHTPVDGNIESYVHRQISIAFPWFYYFYVEQADSFVLNCSSGQKELVIQALNKSQQLDNYEQYYKSPKPHKPGISDFYELQFEKNYTLLRLKSFSYGLIKKHKLKSRKFYKGIFEQMGEAGLANLIIDLRDNRGGRNEFADDIIPFILKKGTETAFLKKSVSWEGKEKVYKLPSARKDAFTGKIFVLVNGHTYSNGSTLARYLREYGQAIIIGEETGTRYEGFAAGSKQEVTLPHSQLRIGIPRYHILFPVSELQATQNRGLIPDHEVKPGIEDLINENDPAMDLTLTLIEP